MIFGEEPHRQRAGVMSVASVARTPEEQANVMTWARNVYVPPRSLIERATGGASARFVKEVAAQMPKLLRPEKPMSEMDRARLEDVRSRTRTRERKEQRKAGKARRNAARHRAFSGKAGKKRDWKALARINTTKNATLREDIKTARDEARSLNNEIKELRKIVAKGPQKQDFGSRSRFATRMIPINKEIDALGKRIDTAKAAISTAQGKWEDNRRAIEVANMFHARALRTNNPAEEKYWEERMETWMGDGGDPDKVNLYLTPFNSRAQRRAATLRASADTTSNAGESAKAKRARELDAAADGF